MAMVLIAWVLNTEIIYFYYIFMPDTVSFIETGEQYDVYPREIIFR